jgi:hypothetical protein
MLGVRFIACNANSKQCPSHFHNKTYKLAFNVINDCVPFFPSKHEGMHYYEWSSMNTNTCSNVTSS